MSNSGVDTMSENTIGSRSSVAIIADIDAFVVAIEKEKTVISPPEGLQDRMVFFFNNLCESNLQIKCDELCYLVSNGYWPWISQYLVTKRASTQYKHHALLVKVLDILQIQEVYNVVIEETLKNIRVLLRSEKSNDNLSDRSLLKSLGHWLGMLTLGRNKPILQIDLNALLVEAYYKGQQELLYVVPFVTKILEWCAKSRDFKPPNPWTMAMLKVLAELHQKKDLKMSLKFDIMTLCKSLNVDVLGMKPVGYLENTERPTKTEHQLLPPNKSDNTIQLMPPPSSTFQFSIFKEPQLPGVDDPVTKTSSITKSGCSIPSYSLFDPSEPKYSYLDIQLTGNGVFQPRIPTRPNIDLFGNNRKLGSFARIEDERVKQSQSTHVVDEPIHSALTATKNLARQGYTLDTEVSRMRDAEQNKMADGAANVVGQNNTEITRAFVQKTAIGKTIHEVDKKSIKDFELKKSARQEGRRYGEASAPTFQTERMSEAIRLEIDSATPIQTAVDEGLVHSMFGSLSLTETSPEFFIDNEIASLEPRLHPATPFQSRQNMLDMLAVYNKITFEVDQMVQYFNYFDDYENIIINLGILQESLVRAMRIEDRVDGGTNIVKTCVKGLQDSLLPVANDPKHTHMIMQYKQKFVNVLKSLQDARAFGQHWINQQVTRLLTDCEDHLRYNISAVDTLIRAGLVNVPQYDLDLAQVMDNGKNDVAVTFATKLVQLFLIEDRSNQFVTESNFTNTIDILKKIASCTPQSPEDATNESGMLREGHVQSVFFDDPELADLLVHIHNGITHVSRMRLEYLREHLATKLTPLSGMCLKALRHLPTDKLETHLAQWQVTSLNYDHPPILVQQTDLLLKSWINIYRSQLSGEKFMKKFNEFVRQINVCGVFKTDELTKNFFRLLTQLCIESVYKNIREDNRKTVLMQYLDPFVRLIELLVKHAGDANNITTKIYLLNKVLGIITGCLLLDHKQRSVNFNQLPYFRILITLFLELCSPEPFLEAINFQVLTVYGYILHILRPSKAPGFCYAWLDLISHRVFIARMLEITPQQKGWNMYAQLLIDLFKYLAPFLRNTERAEPVTMLNKGTLRLLLVLSHDFPEFLSGYCYGFCDVIPPNCIQMRNLILSATPRGMLIPSPFTPSLKIDVLQEITYPPGVLINVASLITPPQFKKDLDSYLQARAPITFLSELRGNLQISNEPGMRYNIPLMNALVMYVGTQAIAYIRSKSLTPKMETIAHSAHMDIFQNLAFDFDTEARYLFFSAIANQLRYPNSHTHYFMCVLLHLYAKTNVEAVKERIVRVLLERVMVDKPYPWGLLITFIELIKNPRYKFWDREFVHCGREIRTLLESLAQSWMIQADIPVQAQ